MSDEISHFDQELCIYFSSTITLNSLPPSIGSPSYQSQMGKIELKHLGEIDLPPGLYPIIHALGSVLGLHLNRGLPPHVVSSGKTLI